MSKYKVGDIVSMKKSHPCGSNRWKILKTGVNIKLECQGCGRSLLMKRTDFNRHIRKIQDKEGKMVSIVHYQPEEDLETGQKEREKDDNKKAADG